MHAILRALPSVPRLRQRAGYEAIRAALLRLVEGDDFRVVHVSIQSNHLHLIVEAAHKQALRRGMQRFAIRAARALNAEFDRAGKVFAFRYCAKQIKTAHYARNAIAYVLNNWRKHAEDRRTGAMSMPFDRFSSGSSFSGWASHAADVSDERLPVSQPRTHLLRSDWQRFGLVGPFELPARIA